MCDIDLDSVFFKYNTKAEDDWVITDLSLNIKSESYVVIAGKNGSGKSTIARMLNALLIPVQGNICINGMNTKEEKLLWEIRKQVGMVFQNPENQIISTVVEEDVAFGPENIGIEPKEIRKRVDWALKQVDMYNFRKSSSQNLSGGQKQRLAIAGILAMKPRCIIMDEATSMLDPIGKKEVLSTIMELNKNEKITIINITHNMDEALDADRLIILDKGRVLMDDKPSEILCNVEILQEVGLDVPPVTELFYKLSQEGLMVPKNVLSIEKGLEVLKSLM